MEIKMKIGKKEIEKDEMSSLTEEQSQEVLKISEIIMQLLFMKIEDTRKIVPIVSMSALAMSIVTLCRLIEVNDPDFNRYETFAEIVKLTLLNINNKFEIIKNPSQKVN